MNNYYYFIHIRSKEVLKIIAKVLALNDEQLVILGLKVPNIDIVSTIITSVIGKPTEKQVLVCTIYLLYIVLNIINIILSIIYYLGYSFILKYNLIDIYI